MRRHQLFFLVRRCRHFHGIKAVKIIDRLQSGHLGHGEAAERGDQRIAPHQSVFGQPGGIRMIHRRLVGGGGIIPPPGNAGQIVGVIRSGGRCLKHDVAERPRDDRQQHIRQRQTGVRRHYDDIFLFRCGIVPSPRNLRPHRVGRGRHGEHRPVIAQR